MDKKIIKNNLINNIDTPPYALINLTEHQIDTEFSNLYNRGRSFTPITSSINLCTLVKDLILFKYEAR